MAGSTLAIAEVSSAPRKTKRQLVFMVRREIGLHIQPGGIFPPKAPFAATMRDFVATAGVSVRPLFGVDERRLRLELSAVPPTAPQGPDLSTYYTVDTAEERLDEIAGRLRAMDMVYAAYIKPPVALPALNAMAPRAAVAPVSTPDFVSRQIYLDPAPAGVDARYAWKIPGGTGRGMQIIDVEGEWRFSHEDLALNKGGVVGGAAPNDQGWRNHGTAVIGVFAGDRNAFGITGICSGAEVKAVSIFPSEESSPAIRLAASLLRPGDVLLVELHRPGPRYNYDNRDDQLGFVPVEWWPDDFDAIRYATSRGIVVVEAGGNGAENLDDSLYETPQAGFPKDWTNPFSRKNRDSGAILVGAGAPPPKSHGRSWGPDRSRLDFSNYGECIDVQGWGREVTSCGYGDLQGGGSEDIWYTDQFSGTSSASPVVVGVLGCIGGILRDRNQMLTPSQARSVLRNTGSPQQDAPGRPASQWIGNRPDLRQIIASLGLSVAAPNAPKKRAARTSVIRKRRTPAAGKRGRKK
jgi:hypothetical protein